MITSNYQVDGDIYSYADKFFCDSSDDKPSNADAKDGLLNGASLEETDTGKTYIFTKKANQWTEKAAGGSTTLAGLTDVDISNPSNGQTLVYNASTGKWENSPPRTLMVRKIYDKSADTTTLSETWQTLYDAIREGVFVYMTDNSEDDVEFDMMSCQGQVKMVFHSSSEGYKVETNDGLSGDMGFVAASANDYPVWL